MDADALAELRSRLGDAGAVTDPDVVAGYVRDWTGRHVGRSELVLRPSTTEEVAVCLEVCDRRGVAVVPQGGNTGLVGGATPLGGEAVLHLGRLRGIEDLDDRAGTVVARAGTTLAEVQRAALAAGWEYGVDLSARDSATIGGTVATNAGGLHVIRWGDTRAQLLGMEAVLAGGAVVGSLRGLRKDNTGYHLPGLLAGSEGTLGVVTRVALRLVPAAADRAVALLGHTGVAAAMATVGALRRRLSDVAALELMLGDGMDLVSRTFGLPAPFAQPCSAAVLVEVAGEEGALDRLVRVVDALDTVTDSVVAEDGPRRAALWRYREAQTEAIARVGVAHKLDVTLPARELPAFTDEVRRKVREEWPDAAVWLFGHAGDGNIHVNVTGVDPGEDRVDDMVLRLTAERGGSISAEHGIGRAKAGWLPLNRSAADIDVMRRIKRALDPKGILNPGALFAPAR